MPTMIRLFGKRLFVCSNDDFPIAFRLNNTEAVRIGIASQLFSINRLLFENSTIHKAIRMRPPLLVNVEFLGDMLVGTFQDGRMVACPVRWFPRLVNASDEDRLVFKILRGGRAVHWPVLDEDLSATGFFTYAPKEQTT